MLNIILEYLYLLNHVPTYIHLTFSQNIVANEARANANKIF